MKAICTDCQREKEIALTFKAVAQVEINGISKGTLIDINLCKGCMRNRAQGLKRLKQNH